MRAIKMPNFVHYCEECQFLGEYEIGSAKWDLYVHEYQFWFFTMVEVIARYGNGVDDIHYANLDEAYMRVLEITAERAREIHFRRN